MTPPPKYPVPWLRYTVWALVIAGPTTIRAALKPAHGLGDTLIAGTVGILIAGLFVCCIDLIRRKRNRAAAQQAARAAVLQVSAVEAAGD